MRVSRVRHKLSTGVRWKRYQLKRAIIDREREGLGQRPKKRWEIVANRREMEKLTKERRKVKGERVGGNVRAMSRVLAQTGYT